MYFLSMLVEASYLLMEYIVSRVLFFYSQLHFRNIYFLIKKTPSLPEIAVFFSLFLFGSSVIMFFSIFLCFLRYITPLWCDCIFR